MLKIGTRGSRLALWQAYFTKDVLEKKGFEVSITIIKTQGDRIQNQTFDKLEGKGFFTKELEEALLKGTVDFAVHSFKDLPTEEVPQLSIVANSYRANPFDRLLIGADCVDDSQLFKIKQNAVVGTSSPRRASQLLHFRPDLTIVPIRGNVPTRVAKIGQEVDAVVLAAAGIDRLELELGDVYSFEFTPEYLVPAPAQGVLAYQCRTKDTETSRALNLLHDVEVAACVHIERSILQQLEGGCQQPIGIYCKKEGESFKLWVSHSDAMESPLTKITLEGTDGERLIAEAVSVIKKKQLVPSL